MASSGVESKVVLIVGASTGIGESLAIHLADVGYRSLVLVARRADLLGQVAEKCKAKGASKVLELVKDLTLAQSPEEIIAQTIKEFQRLDIMVCNAATLGNVGAVCEQTASDFDHVMNVNVRSHMLLTRFALPHLQESKGNVLYVSSSLGIRTKAGMSLYSCSKAALNMLAQSVALENAPKGVRANVLSLGPVVTDMLKDLIEQRSSQAEKSVSERSINLPLGRVAQPIDVARTAAFLISDHNCNMTGANVTSDGGHLIN